MKDIKAKIIENKNIKGNYYKMALEAPHIAKYAKPGQFMQVRCGDGVDPLLRRPLSIHRLKGRAIEVLYEVVGKGTDILSKRKAGEYPDVLGPLGNGFSLPSNVNRQSSTLLIAGGIGAAPLVFLAEELARKKVKTVVLIGAKTKNLILCEKDFKKTGAELRIATDDGSRGCKGFITDLLKELLVAGCELRVTNIYACGPQPMLKCIAGICEKHKIDCEVSMEEVMACGIGACLGCAVRIKSGGYKLACKDGPVFDAKEISW